MFIDNLLINETPLWWDILEGKKRRQYNKFKVTKEEAIYFFNKEHTNV